VVIDTKQLYANNWNWDLVEFARRLGLSDQTQYTKELFQKFRVLCQSLAAFDEGTLSILVSKDKE